MRKLRINRRDNFKSYYQYFIIEFATERTSFSDLTFYRTQYDSLTEMRVNFSIRTLDRKDNLLPAARLLLATTPLIHEFDSQAIISKYLSLREQFANLTRLNSGYNSPRKFQYPGERKVPFVGGRDATDE